MAVVALGGCGSPDGVEGYQAPIDPTTGRAVINFQGYTYVPPDPAAYKQSEEIKKWADDFDDAAIERHAWDLWKAVNIPSGQFQEVGGVKIELPAWETWFDEYEIFHLPTGNANKANASRFHLPRQATNTPLVSFNKYSLPFQKWIDQHRLWDEATLIKLNERFKTDNTPLGERIVSDDGLDPKATILKPSFWIVKKDRPSPMPYWKGPGDTHVDGTLWPDKPIPTTWTQIVVVDPTGTAKPGTPYTLDISSKTGSEKMTFTDYEIVKLDRFYWLPLSADDVAWIKSEKVYIIGGIPVEDLEEGDLALLVASHITTAEFGPWTWQSFWWSPDPATKAPSDVPAPWNNYDLTQSYYMIGKDEKPWIAQNPYLETSDSGPVFFNPKEVGVRSNCMTCHHAAAYPTINMDPTPGVKLHGSYFGLGEIKGTEQYFTDRVKTSYMWSMVFSNQQQNKAN